MTNEQLTTAMSLIDDANYADFQPLIVALTKRINDCDPSNCNTPTALQIEDAFEKLVAAIDNLIDDVTTQN